MDQSSGDICHETEQVLADPDLMASHVEGRAAIDAGDYLDADGLAAVMQAAVRSRR